MDSNGDIAGKHNEIEFVKGRTDNHFAGHFEAETQLIGNQVYGDIHVTNAVKEKSPSPTICIPFGRDRHFVERDVLEEILERCSASGVRIGLAGKGGAGKSQLAIETCWRIHEREPDTWIFWAHASSAERLHDGFKNIAHLLGLLQPAQTYDREEIFHLLQSKLSNEHFGKWLLVIDNADDRSALESGSHVRTSKKSRHIQLPVSRKGTIILTSRTKKVLRSMIDYEEDILEVHPMTEKQACDLLLKKLLRDLRDERLARSIVTYLDCMPLALTQAAAYMTTREMPMGDYLRKLRSSYSGGATTLLKDDFRDPRRDGDYSDSILLTWHISFEHIDHEYPTAGELLGRMSLLNRESIPKGLLKKNHPGDLDDDIALLRSYDFITRTEEKDAFSMHRLVQLSSKQWLRSNNRVLETTQRIIAALDATFPDPPETIGFSPDLWPACQRLIPHLKATLSIDKLGTNCDSVFASGPSDVFCRAGLFGEAIMEKANAEMFGRRVYSARTNILGAEHQNTLWAALSLGRILGNRGRYRAAEEVLKKARLDQQKSSYRDTKFECLLIARLGRVISLLERPHEAEEPLKLALKTAEKVFGDIDTTVAEIAQNLATTYAVQGRHEESLPYYEQALNIKSSIFGSRDPHTLTRRQRLAQAMAYAGQLDDAENLVRTTIEQQEQVIGQRHPNTIVSWRILATVLKDQGRHQQAEDAIRMAAKLSLDAFGPNDLRTRIVNREVLNMTGISDDKAKPPSSTSPRHSRTPEPERRRYRPAVSPSPAQDSDTSDFEQRRADRHLDVPGRSDIASPRRPKSTSSMGHHHARHSKRISAEFNAKTMYLSRSGGIL